MINELEQIWRRFVELIEFELSDVSYRTWVLTTQPKEVTDNTFTIIVPSRVAYDTIHHRHKETFKSCISQAAGRSLDLKMVIGTELQNERRLASKHKDKLKPDNLEEEYIDQEEDSSNLVERYTFENFIVGGSNMVAHAAAMAVAESPAKAYNPLFLYGGVGLGKTHLMHAIGHYCRKVDDSLKVKYVTSETFTNELILSIKDNINEKFRDKYRNVDVLLVDDVQFIASREKTQEEFFHTFNALHHADKQIVLTSDRPPKEIKTLEERLRSRFSMGLICDIQIPDYETRTAILKKKAQNEGICIDDEILMYLGQKVKTNIRELEGVFNRVVAFRGLVNSVITLDTAIEALKEYDQNKYGNLTIDTLVEKCAAFYSLKAEDLLSRKRTKNIAEARQVAMYLCKEILEMPFTRIAKFFRKDHTTVMHAHDKISVDLDKDSYTRDMIDLLTNQLTNEPIN